MAGEHRAPLTWAQQEWFQDLGAQEGNAAANSTVRLPVGRLPVAATLMEARRMAGRKPTIFEPKLNQPPDEDGFHVTPADCIIGARDWSVHCVKRGINKSGRPIDTIGVQRVIAGLL